MKHSQRYKWRNQYWYNPNASNFHEAFRQFVLNDSSLSKLNCYQEINVRDLIPTYSYPNHHYDWYIEQLGWVIELHGEQHYKPINFSHKSYDSVVLEFRSQQNRDAEKLIAALQNGYTYIAIPYIFKNKLSINTLERFIYEEKTKDNNGI